MTNRLFPHGVRSRHYLGLTFFAALALAIILVTPFIAYNGGVFYYYGDFNVQEIPFYQLIHSQVRAGELGWNHLTDLGTDTLASYSFYLMGSPFFWLTIPFPNEIVPYLIGPLLILKFACAASAAYCWLQRHVRFKGYAVVGALLYAFSGFSVYNVFFFHFHEPMIVFPLLLAALDCFLYDKRRGIFAVAVFAACVVNYYFFVGQALFVAMYYLTLVFTKTYRFRLSEFFLLAVEVVLGFLGTMFVLLPSILGTLGNPRLSSYPNGWNALVHDRPQRYFLTLFAFFFPADMPAMPTFTPESNCKWASVAGWLPLFGMTGVIAYLQLRRRDWLKKLMVLLMLFAAIPALNSMFQMLNFSIYYTRWFYIPVLLFSLATMRAVEDTEADWKRAMYWSAGITLGLSLLVGFMPLLTEKDEVKDWSIGVAGDKTRFWIYVIFALSSLLALVLIYKKFGSTRTRFFIASGCGVMAVALVTTLFVFGNATLASGSTHTIRDDILNSRDKIEIDDLEDVRSDFYKAVDNTAMFWKVPSINCFQSSVNTSIMKFYNGIGITRDVASRPDFTAYGVRPLLSTKYYFDHTADNKNKDDDVCFTDKNDKTKMPCWRFLKHTNGFDVYENECYIPMGFCFDDYVTEAEFSQLSKVDQPQALLCGLVLSEEDMKKNADITGYYGGETSLGKSMRERFVMTDKRYKETCTKLAQNACDRFAYTKEGFEAHFNNQDKARLLFFSVPYSDGFTAAVNGAEAQIFKADFGLMAIRLPAQTDCDIVFTYRTPGFKMGSVISLAALAGFAVYIAVVLLIKRKRRLNHAI